ncbi:conserved Plasmodium membrane protein, unknown function [Plasmodium sp. gorilla clade G2]|uniref:conserved Plasmodium membrane protein, unknown function n=1 Tax=Plasmodium sp. gorilla clade G2 TaxID=880535 RepID=UPI000D2155C5|nr:conserved Plasmodium membrane protein, unknown function [Plasmodium sp. gorilla clade G2]SOV13449.1 conserved Plasmodium membrane protein, unknown function [Plasmodium sp. gorilla clade G2]
MKKNKISLFFISSLVCAFVTLTFYKRYRYEFDRNYVEQRLSLYSEESFYFSFYNDIVKSNTFLEGINCLLKDNRSEYPDTINAIKRFNIYPEIILGALWKGLNLESYILTPYNFYVYAVIFLQAASVSVLFFFSVYIGKSYFPGVIFLMLFFSCFREKFIMRLSAFPLRENFASVFMWCNIVLIYIILKNKEIPILKYIGLFFSSLLCFLFWQFSVFVSVTHIVSLFIVDLLGYNITNKLNHILFIFCSSYLLSIIITFFPRYLLCTYFPYVLLAILTTNILFNYVSKKKNDDVNKNNKINNMNEENNNEQSKTCTFARSIKRKSHQIINNNNNNSDLKNNNNHTCSNYFNQYDEGKKEEINDESTNKYNKNINLYTLFKNLYIIKNWIFILKKGLTSIFIFFILRLIIFSKDKDDSHVISLLKVRLKLANHNFDTMLYSSGSEFNPFSKYMFHMLKESAVYEYFIIFNILFFIYILNYCKQLLKKKQQQEKEQEKEKEKEQIEQYDIFKSSFVFLINQLLFFISLMLIISRLRVLALPLICLFSSLIGSPHFLGNLRENKGRLQKIIIFSICLVQCAYPFKKYFPQYEYMNMINKEPINLQKNLDLIIWLQKNIKEEEALIADIPTSSFLRCTTNYKFILHPQYEDSNLRKRVQDYYMFSACLPFSDGKKYFYEKYKSRYFISNIYRCSSSGSQINVFTISDKIESNYARCVKKKKTMRFCNRVLYDDKNYKTLYRNGKFSVIYFTPEIIPDNTPYKFFNQKKYSNIIYYEPWIKRCMLTDDKCALHITEVARIYLDILKYNLIAFTLYEYVENNLMNNNVEVIFHIAEFYDYDKKDHKKANELYRKAINLIIKEESDLNTYIIGQTPFVSIPRKIQILSSFLYFIVDMSLYKDKQEILLIYKNMNELIQTALFALDNGFYYEIIKSTQSNQKDQIIKRYFYKKELHTVINTLCQNIIYLKQIQHEHIQYIHIYNNLWTLIKKLSHMESCVIENLAIYENRKIKFLDYLLFFYTKN